MTKDDLKSVLGDVNVNHKYYNQQTYVTLKSRINQVCHLAKNEEMNIEINELFKEIEKGDLLHSVADSKPTKEKQIQYKGYMERFFEIFTRYIQ